MFRLAEAQLTEGRGPVAGEAELEPVPKGRVAAASA